MKRGFTIWQLLLLLALLGIIAAILFPIFARARGGGKSTCQSSLKNIGLGFQQYLQDYDENYPAIREGSTNRGWVDSLQPYMKSHLIFQCPSINDRSFSTDSNAVIYTDYFLNARLSAIPSRRVTSPAKTVLSGDGDNDMDVLAAHYAVRSIPIEWLSDTTSPRYRHVEGSNFGFVDGHVKWLKATDPIPPTRTKTTKYTFSP